MPGFPYTDFPSSPSVVSGTGGLGSGALDSGALDAGPLDGSTPPLAAGTAGPGSGALDSGPLDSAPLDWSPPPPPPPPSDADILADVVARLEATGLFDEVILAELPGQPAASDREALARVIPGAVTDESDADGGGVTQVVHRGAYTVEIQAKGQDAASRNRLLAQLCNAARNAVNNASLADATFPALTTLKASGVPSVAPPFASATMQGSYEFVITEGWASFDDTFPH